jgi:hypothetical protein
MLPIHDAPIGVDCQRQAQGEANREHPRATTNPIVCAWCGLVMHAGTPGLLASHGICGPCAVAAWIAADKTPSVLPCGISQ